jgi:hypothetical protein
MWQRLFIIKAAVFIIGVLIFNAPLTLWASSEKDVTVESYLNEGDTRMFNGEQEDAQKIYEFVLKEDPHSYEALWRLSRFYISWDGSREDKK